MRERRGRISACVTPSKSPPWPSTPATQIIFSPLCSVIPTGQTTNAEFLFRPTADRPGKPLSTKIKIPVARTFRLTPQPPTYYTPRSGKSAKAPGKTATNTTKSAAAFLNPPTAEIPGGRSRTVCLKTWCKFTSPSRQASPAAYTPPSALPNLVIILQALASALTVPTTGGKAGTLQQPTVARLTASAEATCPSRKWIRKILTWFTAPASSPCAQQTVQKPGSVFAGLRAAMIIRTSG